MIIAVANQKGGVGKSTTAHAIGAGLAYAGHKVLFVDLDAQGNLTYALGVQEAPTSSYEVLMGRASALESIVHAGAYDAILSSSNLHGADVELTEIGKEYRLKEALSGVAGRYEYIVIDTPPALGTLTINAMTAADGLIIPAQADVFSIQGVGQLFQTVEAVRRYCNPSLRVLGILLTRHSDRSIISRDMKSLLQETAERFGTVVYQSTIRENVAAREAAASRQDIFNYAPRSNAARDYESLIDEIMLSMGG